MQEMSTHAQLSRTRFDVCLCTVSLRLALSPSVVSSLFRWGAAVCERTCIVRFRSGVQFGVIVPFAPISLDLFSLRSPRIVRRLVLPSCQ